MQQYVTHKQMPSMIRKAKKVVLYSQLGANTSLSAVVEKGDILETFRAIAKNESWPDVFNVSTSDNGWLYINGSLETKYHNVA